MARLKLAQELIIPTFTNWERVGSITGILADLEDGNYFTAALLVDQFMRDDAMRGLWDVAIQAVLGAPMHMEAADHTNKRGRKRSDKISEQAEKLWPKMVPDAELMELMLWGLFLGAGVARVNWDGWVPSIKTWHAGALRYDVSTDVYMLRTRDQGEIPILPDDPNWLLFTPWGYKYGRLRCYLVSIAMLVLERNWTRRDRARRSEKHGLPFQQLVVPADSSSANKAIAARASAALGTETTSVTPQGAPGNVFDWKFWEPASTLENVFGGSLKEIRESMAILLLGQATSTGGTTGLQSNANPGDVQQRNKLRFYAKCIGGIGRDKLLSDWAGYNFGNRNLAPTPMIEVDPPKDEAQKATAFYTLMQGLAIAPVDVDKRTILTDADIPVLTLEQVAQAAKDAAQQASTIGAAGKDGAGGKQPANPNEPTPAEVKEASDDE